MTLSDSSTLCHCDDFSTHSHSLHSASEIIEAMINLRIELAALEQRIKELQPAFAVACASFHTDKIKLEQAIISRRLTPAQWTYPDSILAQEAALKQLKQQFQKQHEPTGGREIIWSIKLLDNR